MPIGKIASPVNFKNIYNAYIKEDLYKASDIGKQVTSAENSAKNTRSFYRPYIDFLNERKTRFDALYEQIDNVQSDLNNHQGKRSLLSAPSHRAEIKIQGEDKRFCDEHCRDPARLRARATILDAKMKIIEQKYQNRLVNKGEN